MGKICSLFGHKDFYETTKYEKPLMLTLEMLITKHNITTFYVGRNGYFDTFCAITIKKLKEKYPNIELVLVYAYLNKKMHPYDKEFIQETFTYTIYPPINSVPKRYAIIERNKWMINNSHFVVFFVKHHFGGAGKVLEYAQKKNVPFINIAQKNI